MKELETFQITFNSEKFVVSTLLYNDRHEFDTIEEAAEFVKNEMLDIYQELLPNKTQ